MCGMIAMMPLVSSVVVYGGRMHGTQCVSDVAQLHAPTHAHLHQLVQFWPQQPKCCEGGCRRWPERRWRASCRSTLMGTWPRTKLVQIDDDGQKCGGTPPVPSNEERAVTVALLARVEEGQATVDLKGVLDCAVLLDHGHLLALPPSEPATYGADTCATSWLSTRQS